MTTEVQQIIETTCEAYSENYATFSVEAVINMLDELYPTDKNSINVGEVVRAIRKDLKLIYNIQ
jgi:hypothetical protein